MKDFLNDLLDKYVGMNTETRERTILAFLMALLDFLSAFHIIEFTDAQIQAIYKLLLVISTAIVWAYCSHYKNNDYTEAALKGTGITRQIKKEQTEGYIGERFYTNENGELLTSVADSFEPEDEDEDVMEVEMAVAEAASQEENLEREEDE